MPARRALRLLRPFFTQPRRPISSCTDRGPPPLCPPCESAPPPPCRTDHKAPLQGERVVCCPPPQGQRPPCVQTEPECARTCEHQLPQKPEKKTASPKKLCGTARDAVEQRMLDYEEHRRRLYERAAAERLANPPQRPIPSILNIQPASKHVIATDGRAYEVISDAPTPRCAPASSHCSAPHPPATPISLAPLGDCIPKETSGMDPCEHKPRTILTIDRGDPESAQTRSASPKPAHENPRSDKANYKGITSRIMDSLRSGRGSSDDKQPGWCNNPPPSASPPPRCRARTITDRIRRKSSSPSKRHLHTSTAYMTTKDASKATGRDALLAASKNLEAMLKERDLLKEAGRGRVVPSPNCKPPLPPPPPPPPRQNGGAMEFSIPAGADAVCVRVSMGKSPLPCIVSNSGATPSSPTSPPPSGGTPRPPQNTTSDSWLSIKKLQKKISSCGRSEPAASPAPIPAPSRPNSHEALKPATPPKPATPATPAPARPKPQNPCSPQGKVKMSDVLPHTIFVK